ncbi:MAG: ferrous iron transporter B [Pyrobaculum sp.]
MVKRYALVGPPNVGKSSLFYALTGVYVKTANYPGTTVEIHRGYVKKVGDKIEVVDLPGVLNPQSPQDDDEKITVKEIAEGQYDGVIVVAAPHALQESLLLAEYASRHKPVALVINMVDLWRPAYSEEELEKLLGVPVVYASATRRLGLEKLTKLMASGIPHLKISTTKLEAPPLYAAAKSYVFSRPALALSLLVGIGLFTSLLLMAVIEGVTPLGQLPFSLSALLEAVDAYIKTWILSQVGGPAGSFLANALWGSLMTIATIMLYVSVALVLVVFYEDSGLIGYLSRRVEGLLASAGVPPRGVVCLLVGASCNVPAAASAGVLWGRGNRVLTALLVPYMPCVARLAIFAAVATAALAKTPYLIPAAILLPYIAGLVFALVASAVYRKVLGIERSSFGKTPPTPLMVPDVGIFFKKVAVEILEFFRKVAPILIPALLLLWPLTAFGPGGYVEDVSQSYMAQAGRALEPLFSPMGLPWEVVAPLAAGWVFKEVVLGLLEAMGGLAALSRLPLPSVMAFLVFTAFYSACVATLATLKKTLGLRLLALSVAVNLALAYVASYATYLFFSILA